MAQRRKPALDTYRRKRRFDATPEPSATARAQGTLKQATRKTAPRSHPFVVHLHHARRRHFDLRLATGRVLRSWAVPKGPSLDPAAKRLAVEVEDHPLGYADFEGTIPKGHYGAGTVAIWDEGTWSTRDPVASQMEKGHLHFDLDGARLHGAWSLVRTRLKGRQPQWLLMKGDDAFASAGDVADDVPLSQWRARTAQAPASSRPPRRRTRAPRLAMPTADAFEFELARLQHVAPEGDAWLHEVKYDGYRMLAWRRGTKLRLYSRNRLDWTQKLPDVGRALGSLACRECVLDGELVVTDEAGRSRFDLLQQAFDRAGADRVRYRVFDLLWLDGADLRASPLIERKATLQALVESAGDALGFSDFILGHGARAWREACKAGLEGVMSKRADSPYRGGRGDDWRKLKCVGSDEFLIVGYTPGQRTRGALGALLLAAPEGRRWRYVGRVGTGMDEAMLEHLQATLDPANAAPPLVGAPDARQLRGARPVWVKPRHVVEVAFRGWTGDGLLRQASFKGLRPDKAPADLSDSDRVTGEADMPAKKSATAAGAKARLTHPGRVLIREPKVTKQRLADFYAGIAPVLLPGLVGRPLSLLRCPEGADAECFFQKHPMAGMPDAVHVGDARKLHGKEAPFVYVDDIEGVLGLVQMNAIELHPWGSTIDDLEHPDRLVFDLDPDTGVAWPRVRKAAMLLRERLRAVGLESFLRTTGGKGLHVVVPLAPRPDWEAAKAFAHALARTLEEESPREYVSVATMGRRRNRIFIDYLRNARGATAIASYCVRARPGAPVATPLRWDELPRLRSASQFTIANVGRRLKSLRQDPWHGIETMRQALPRT